MEYIKIDVTKRYDKQYVQELEMAGWELFSVRTGNDGNVYAVFCRRSVNKK